MTLYSLNETTKLALLAAKGAGYSWGMAEEVSRSVLWLVNRGLPGPKLLLTLLCYHSTPESIYSSIPSISGNQLTANGAWLCPLASGCAVSDFYSTFATDSPIVLSSMKCPFLMLPFVAQIALRIDKVLTLEFDDSSISTDGEHIRLSNNGVVTTDFAVSVICRESYRKESPFNEADNTVTHDRVVVDQTVWNGLSAFAHRTYAPATESSRELGAGSGLNDND